MYGSAVPPSSPFPPERTNYCSCVGRHRRDRTNHTYVSAKNFSKPTTPTYTYLYMPDTDDMTLRNSFTSKQLLHTCLTHLSLGTYLHTFFFFSTTVISSIPFNCYLHHSLAQTQTQTQKLQAKYHTYLTLPTQNCKLSIRPVRELVAGCFRLEIQDSQAASGRGRLQTTTEDYLVTHHG